MYKPMKHGYIAGINIPGERTVVGEGSTPTRIEVPTDLPRIAEGKTEDDSSRSDHTRIINKKHGSFFVAKRKSIQNLTMLREEI